MATTTTATTTTTMPFLDGLSTGLLGLRDFGLITWERALITGMVWRATVVTGGDKTSA